MDCVNHPLDKFKKISYMCHRDNSLGESLAVLQASSNLSWPAPVSLIAVNGNATRMNTLKHTLGVVVGSRGLSEIAEADRSFSTIVSAVPKVVSTEFYTVGRDEFVKKHKYSKRFAILSTVVTTHVVAFFTTTFVFVIELIQYGLVGLGNIHFSLVFMGVWFVILLGEGKLFTFLERKYPRGASGSFARSSDVAPAPMEGTMTKASEGPDLSTPEAPEAIPQDFMTWLELQPKARELATIAERTFKSSDDLTKMAEQRQAHYDKVWGALHPTSEEVQPLTR